MGDRAGDAVEPVEYVFVYGTLRPPRPGQDPADSMYYPAVAHQVIRTIPAWLEGAVLYDFGAYPGAYPGRGRIVGDLLAVRPPALAEMDRIEQEGYEYRRAQVTVHTPDGPREAWIYWAPPHWQHRGRPIPSGDWFRRREPPQTSHGASPEVDPTEDPNAP